MVRGRVVTLSQQSVNVLNPETGSNSALLVNGGAVDVSVPAFRTRLLQITDNAIVQSDPDALWQASQWQQPPANMRPFVRWWWPGTAVQESQLRQELNLLNNAGYGGVELQTLTIGLRFTQLNRHRSEIYQVGTAAYFQQLNTVYDEANKLGLQVDMTMGSGWSSGAPFIDEYPSQQLLRSSVDVTGPQAINIPLPPAVQPSYVGQTNKTIAKTIGAFDSNVTLEAVVAGKYIPWTNILSEVVDISDQVVSGNIVWNVPAGDYRLIALYQNNTSHNQVASALPGALQSSPILDHLASGGINEYIQELGEPWLAAIAPNKPDAFFIDSFELIAELPWSSEFKQAFQTMHGYDPSPYLPYMFKTNGESKYVNIVIAPTPAYNSGNDMAQRVREDYELVREQLFVDVFVRPLKTWTQSKGIKLRLQAHGGFGDYLDTYQLADIPEAEGLFGGGTYEFLKLASSAAHVSGQQWVTSESFINMTFNSEALSIDDFYMLAGNAFAAGINHTISHGFAYQLMLDDLP